VADGILAGMPLWTLTEIAAALRASWAADTCSPDDVEREPWTPANPAWGHCDVTALVVNDIFGGRLVLGEVHLDGEQQGLHWWNRLPSGVDLDLTREQFRRGQVVSETRSIERFFVLPRRRVTEYQLLRRRFAQHLGPLPELPAPDPEDG
jgi:hypothetical protein